MYIEITSYLEDLPSYRIPGKLQSVPQTVIQVSDVRNLGLCRGTQLYILIQTPSVLSDLKAWIPQRSIARIQRSMSSDLADGVCDYCEVHAGADHED